jgi:bifunctional NMN adenylyltransferase/nudix hydrolase
MQKSLTVLIGRVSVFHNGHAALLSAALKKSSNVLLLIGSAGKARDIRNPFTYEERKQVVTEWYKGFAANMLGKLDDNFGTLNILPLRDYTYNDAEWAAEVQRKVFATLDFNDLPQDTEKFLTGSDRDSTTWYLKSFGDFFKLALVPKPEASQDLSATELRDDYFKGGHRYDYCTPLATATFLDKFRNTAVHAGLLKEAEFVRTYKKQFSVLPYAPYFLTVDACVIQSGHVLVVQRDAFPGKGLYALPGGFLEQYEKMVDGAIRELIEETSINLSPAQLRGSIVDKEVFDDPNRSTRGRTVTQCFLLKLDDSKPLPKTKAQVGEVRRVLWLPIAQALRETDMWFEDHHAMLETMIARIKS